MILPRATDAYSVRDQDETRTAVETAVSGLESRKNAYLISADRGDADVTLNAGQDAEVQLFETALTIARTVTLGTGYSGAQFHVVRSGLGAGTLDVGGLKTLPAATASWCLVGHNGSAWILLAYGTL